MNTLDLKAELSIRMLELEKALDNGMPYSELKKIYFEVKELHLKIVFADLEHSSLKSQSNDLVIE